MMINVDANDPYVLQLSDSLVDEVVGAVGLPKTSFTHQAMWNLVKGVTNRLARIGVQFERLVAEKGFPEASEWVLSMFCHPPETSFQQAIPQQGPLLIAANHPGAYDALLLFSQIKRLDIKCIATEIPFVKLLPNTSDHMLFASREDSSKRMITMRNMVNHLRAGGTVIYFPSGHRDPDPAVFPGAEKAVHSWLPVFNTFYRAVPGLKVLPAVGSGVVSEFWARHPITWLRRKQIDKHRLAEFGQVISQLLQPGKLMITPAVSFGRAFTQEDLNREGADGDFQASLMAEGQSLLTDHIQQFHRSFR